MSLLLKLSLVIYAVLVTIYCFQKKFLSLIHISEPTRH